jgi:hypothetical protein
MSYPVTFEIDYVERRSRLTTFFRLLLAIPLTFVAFFYGIGLVLVVFAAWFVLLFTARWPAGMYEFVAGVLRFGARFSAYFYLAVDPYPPFGLAPDPAYPARLLIAAPLPHYSRLKVLLRVIYVIPAYVIAYVLTIFMELVAIVSWFAIVILGRQPAGLQNALLFCLAYTTRVHALMLLITETYPPFEP